MAVLALAAASTGRWVEAGPFRSHLRLLMATGPLSPYEVAVVTGLPTGSVLHLLGGRDGRRPPRRLSPEAGRRLLQVGTDDVLELGWRLSPTPGPRAALARLSDAGWSTAEIASATGAELTALTEIGVRSHCNRLLAVRLMGLARALPDTLDDQHASELGRAA